MEKEFLSREVEWPNAKETFVVDTIEELLRRSKLSANLELEYLQKWMFPDGYIHRVKEDKGRVVCLKYDKQPIGLLAYKVFTNKDGSIEISIDFVQGVKSNVSPEVLKNLKWKEKIVDLFLQAAIPVSQRSNGTIIYSDVSRIKKAFEAFKKFGFTGNNYEAFYESNRPVFQNSLGQPVSKSKVIAALKDKQAEYNFINSIRDRFFDKEGKLNPNKARVKEILKRLAPFLRPKRAINRKHFSKKIVVRKLRV
ncbi:MAG: hypothetical protein PHU47_02600 [Candidatus ainarchaeum sp.]|nr:hypothetical protein [Candidatus ainarchaeum sp.]